jgi:L-2-hydroxyglutarate oxidase LhgO
MINANIIAANLNAGTNFAGIDYTTNVSLSAAARKAGYVAQKHTTANVQLFGTVRDFSLFANQVKRNANISDFVLSDNWFEHTDKFSIVKNKNNDNLYLYAIFNNSHSTYTINGHNATREQVAELCTKSVADKLLDHSKTVYNKRNDVTHSIHCRTISIDNINRMTLNNQSIN